MSTDASDSMTCQFPKLNAQKVEGEPTYEIIKTLEKALIENASSILSELGGGAHGYPGLFSRPEKYQVAMRY